MPYLLDSLFDNPGKRSREGSGLERESDDKRCKLEMDTEAAPHVETEEVAKLKLMIERLEKTNESQKKELGEERTFRQKLHKQLSKKENAVKELEEAAEASKKLRESLARAEDERDKAKKRAEEYEKRMTEAKKQAEEAKTREEKASATNMALRRELVYVRSCAAGAKMRANASVVAAVENSKVWKHEAEVSKAKLARTEKERKSLLRQVNDVKEHLGRTEENAKARTTALESEVGVLTRKLQYIYELTGSSLTENLTIEEVKDGHEAEAISNEVGTSGLEIATDVNKACDPQEERVDTMESNKEEEEEQQEEEQQEEEQQEEEQQEEEQQEEEQQEEEQQEEEEHCNESVSKHDDMPFTEPTSGDKLYFNTSQRRRNDAERWNNMLAQLVEYMNTNNGQLPTTGDKNGPHKQLYLWVAEQRKRYRATSIVPSARKRGGKRALYEEEYIALERIGFVFSPLEERWEMNFKKLKKFEDKHGHFDVPRSEDLSLHNWIKDQRRKYCIRYDKTFPQVWGNAPLSLLHETKLRSIGVVFAVPA